MIEYRPIDLAVDYPTLCEWWSGHSALAVPREILPDGWFACVDGVEVAASFLYLCRGQIAVIEWTTTNPACKLSKNSLAAVKGLFAHLEEVARSEGCIVVISFVKPNGSEQRIVEKIGYATSTDDVGHRLYAKPLSNEDRWEVPKGGVMQCPSH